MLKRPCHDETQSHDYFCLNECHHEELEDLALGGTFKVSRPVTLVNYLHIDDVKENLDEHDGQQS